MTVAQRTTAAAIIARKGQAVTLTRRAAGAYDPATGAAAITETTQSTKGVILPFSAGTRHSGNSNVPAGAVQCILSALSGTTAITAPNVDDTLTDANGKVWIVSEVSPLQPAGMDIIYDLTLTGTG